MIKEYDICHTSCYSNLEYELETLSRVCKVSFDFSDEHDDDYMKRVCPFVTYAFFSGSDMSEEEIHALAKKAAGYGTKIIGITRGSKGSVFYDGTEFYTQGICKVDMQQSAQRMHVPTRVDLVIRTKHEKEEDYEQTSNGSNSSGSNEYVRFCSTGNGR